MSNDESSGPNLGSGAESLVRVGLRPVGGWTTGCGAGIDCRGGGSTFASGAPQGVADAVGAGLIATTHATAAIVATDSEAPRKIAGNVTPFQGAKRRIDVCGGLM